MLTGLSTVCVDYPVGSAGMNCCQPPFPVIREPVDLFSYQRGGSPVMVRLCAAAVLSLRPVGRGCPFFERIASHPVVAWPSGSCSYAAHRVIHRLCGQLRRGLSITPFAPGAGAPTGEACVDCRSTAPGAKGEARTPSRPLFAPGAKGEARAPSRPLFAPGAGAPTREVRVDCRSTAPGAKGEARTPSQPLFAPGAGAPTQEARA